MNSLSFIPLKYIYITYITYRTSLKRIEEHFYNIYIYYMVGAHI